MGEAKRRRLLDPTWGQPKSLDQYKVISLEVPLDEAACEKWKTPAYGRAILKLADEHGWPRGSEVLLYKSELEEKIQQMFGDRKGESYE